MAVPQPRRILVRNCTVCSDRRGLELEPVGGVRAREPTEPGLSSFRQSQPVGLYSVDNQRTHFGPGNFYELHYNYRHGETYCCERVIAHDVIVIAHDVIHRRIATRRGNIYFKFK